MPSLVIHGILPLLPLLAMRRVDPRKVWWLFPLTFVPDLDYFLGFHRATTSNLFILIPGFVLAWYAWRHPARRALAEWGLIANAYLGSHLLMDAFMGGIVPFYPFSTWTLCYYARIRVVTATNTPFLDWGNCSRPGIPTVTDVYTFITYEHTAMLALLGVLAAGYGIARLRRHFIDKRRG